MLSSDTKNQKAGFGTIKNVHMWRHVSLSEPDSTVQSTDTHFPPGTNFIRHAIALPVAIHQAVSGYTKIIPFLPKSTIFR
jgi:hypothetical protein